MASSIGFRIFSFLPSCYSSYGAWTFTPVGLSPTVHASLRWTHTFEELSRREPLTPGIRKSCINCVEPPGLRRSFPMRGEFSIAPIYGAEGQAENFPPQCSNICSNKLFANLRARRHRGHL